MRALIQNVALQLHSLTRPMMRATASLLGSHALWLLGKDLQELGPPDLLAKDHSAASISAKRMKNMLRDVQSNYANFC